MLKNIQLGGVMMLRKMVYVDTETLDNLLMDIFLMNKKLFKVLLRIKVENLVWDFQRLMWEAT